MQLSVSLILFLTLAVFLHVLPLSCQYLAPHAATDADADTDTDADTDADADADTDTHAAKKSELIRATAKINCSSCGQQVK